MSELWTPRLHLRPFRLEDVPAVHSYAGDPEVVRYMDWGPNSPADTENFVSSAVRPPDGVHPFAVERSGTLIGAVELRVTAAAHRRGEFGYVLARSAWGQGYATEAAAAVLAYAFEQAELHRVAATCDPANIASRRVLEKIGMEYEGHLRDYLHIRGEKRDRLLFAALRP
ncbi:RimJ/RimL family protein N-acetyltransferase [Actinoplanes campanulatus]|uniref:RimJ/RimL family protein N-acetyltransferase n=1 Tax=Actinoplanes campanulatus TaxID=113559 RepID=A0A7W5ALD9_9ACTN|nr:GNAT family N-acetyltransferase [Actinoplanes campanulatus]MBB3098418.1 RimJ/RimL family protein N-acetyltransferase [Actinoplanes campanulatus]GGN35151.1 N-acetyltransferase [Actinoplanes campanulatus]GID39111.1 N-acetyltransferase [Actinoplanes campanulatus]